MAKKQPLYPSTKGTGKGYQLLIYDLRGVSLAQISAITNQYPARLYRTHGIDHVHYETTESNIGECYAKAKQDNAVAMMIQEYGIHWYIRN